MADGYPLHPANWDAVLFLRRLMLKLSGVNLMVKVGGEAETEEQTEEGYR